VAEVARTGKWVAVLATVDTKGPEADFLRGYFRQRGWQARVVDVGLRPPPDGWPAADVGREEVARAAGLEASDLAHMRRDRALAATGEGAGRILLRWWQEGRLAAAVGIGGNQGTAAACIALRGLPLSVPKVVVSTVASGNLRPYLQASDIAVMFSVADFVGGPNRITRTVLARAAGMVLGAVEAEQPPQDDRPAVALTALGNTHGAVSALVDWLREEGYEPVTFHASGAGGTAMEQLAEQGAFAAVLDVTTHELVGEVFPEDIYAPVRPGRLRAVGRLGLPAVVAPGGLDYFIFGAPDTVPEKYRDRPTHHHNPYNTNVQARPEEVERVAVELVDRLNEAAGPAALVVPLRGWSYIGEEGGPLWDPRIPEALRAVARRRLRPSVRYVEVDAPINHPEFVRAVQQLFREVRA
jgi:uncharacterized protein (UPF0261 family)